MSNSQLLPLLFGVVIFFVAARTVDLLTPQLSRVVSMDDGKLQDLKTALGGLLGVIGLYIGLKCGNRTYNDSISRGLVLGSSLLIAYSVMLGRENLVGLALPVVALGAVGWMTNNCSGL